jgi:CheY-like chemotaxis protein
MSVGMKFPTVPVDEVPKQAALLGEGASHPVILVVDDESAIADTVAEILTRSGYAAVPAYDAEEALETAVGQHGAVAHLVLLHLFDGFVGLGHGEGFGLRLHAVARGYVEHLFQAVGAAGGVAADGAHAGDERKGVHRTGEGGTPTKHSVPVGRSAWM